MPASDEAKRESRRQSYRLTKIRAKQRYVEEYTALQKEIDRLKERLRVTIKSNAGSMLAWQQVALALREASVDAALENSTLIRRVSHTKGIVEDLQRWITRLQSPVVRNIGSRESWHHTFLTASDSRHMGMQWIVDHLYAQVDQVFLSHSEIESLDVDLSVYDGRFQGTLRGQLILPCSMQHASDILWFRNPSIDPQRSEVVEQLHVDCKYLREQAGFDSERCTVSVVYGRYISDHRIVHTARAVLEDEKHPWERGYHADYMEWFVIEPAGKGTRMRYETRAFHPFRPDGTYLPLSLLAKNRGVDTSSGNFEGEFVRIGREINNERQKELQAMLFRAAVETKEGFVELS
ncbi:hypothetical protein Ae201684_015229 [Aphanomyces euteiches]|uniref:Uncharacterized protein n=1 Tax=Aphanomyces euteiches TaxID=100861 RepID=A0A6G0WHH8_9STRA|nr:hypothetical protein Ae201684_015229 [Aphanomyces euteiches]KAH9133827.1 hypothetical protein AeRB84_020198 [Aphanomyces euteiches]